MDDPHTTVPLPPHTDEQREYIDTLHADRIEPGDPRLSTVIGGPKTTTEAVLNWIRNPFQPETWTYTGPWPIPPMPPEVARDMIQHGCICPVGAEATCHGFGCPRRKHDYARMSGS